MFLIFYSRETLALPDSNPILMLVQLILWEHHVYIKVFLIFNSQRDLVSIWFHTNFGATASYIVGACVLKIFRQYLTQLLLVQRISTCFWFLILCYILGLDSSQFCEKTDCRVFLIINSPRYINVIRFLFVSLRIIVWPKDVTEFWTNANTFSLVPWANGWNFRSCSDSMLRPYCVPWTKGYETVESSRSYSNVTIWRRPKKAQTQMTDKHKCNWLAFRLIPQLIIIFNYNFFNFIIHFETYNV